jgi:hypothetical protein
MFPMQLEIMHRVVLAWLTDKVSSLGGSSIYGRSYDYHMSLMLSGNCADSSLRMRDLRSIFSETEMVVVKDFLNHSHGASAAMRTTASDRPLRELVARPEFLIR